MSFRQLPELDVHYDLTGPCADCPFRSDAKFHAGVFRDLQHLIPSVEMREALHTCHKTDPVADGFNPSYRGPIQHCGGLLAMMAKDVSIVCGPQARAYDSGRWNVMQMDSDAPVFESLSKMVRHYVKLAKTELAKRSA